LRDISNAFFYMFVTETNLYNMIKLTFQNLTKLLRNISLIFSLLIVFCSTGYAQTNLLTNGDFENGTTGWSSWGDAKISSTTDKHSGNSAVLVSNRKDTWQSLARDVKSLLENGKSYTISAWVKIPKPGLNFRITLGTRVDGKDSWIGLCRTEKPKTGLYVYYTETFELKWNGTLQGANIYFELESVGGVFSDMVVDDVILSSFTPTPDVIQTGPGLKDIKSSMLIGGCIGGTKNYFNSEAAKAQVLKDCNTITITC